MIAAAALLALAQTALPPPDEPEIVVLGQLRALQANVGQGPDGKWYCSLSGSTGPPKLDDKFCRAVTKCVRKGASDSETVDTCIRTTRNRLAKRVEKEMKKGSK